ncbi:YidB family protein [Variovorax sp. J22R133]|uniref:YidB family protein n=1 Tax=Variovorax brevis TaxID=3053503 RepID=UPI00257913A3|nr:YidB family protein [Variovorax sp. J22R133]MDM0111762.1 YidB family protein [Variovorax sp. J22R133]
MGLLDSVLGQVLGGGQQQPGQAGATGGSGLEGLGALAGLGSLGALGGGAGGDTGGLAGGLAGALGGLLANDGENAGLGGLISKFQQAGMGDAVNSWVGTGENQPISGQQLQGALGSDAIAGIASKLGINASTLLPLLATMLPVVINQLTPQGKVPEQGVGNQQDLIGSLTSMLTRG